MSVDIDYLSAVELIDLEHHVLVRRNDFAAEDDRNIVLIRYGYTADMYFMKSS